MTRTLAYLFFAALAFGWLSVACPARADETTTIYEDKTPHPAAAQKTPKSESPAAPTPIEAMLSNTSYSIGLHGGYGIEMGDRPHLDLAEVQPSVAFPISGVMGRSFYRGVLEYRIESFFGLATNMNNRGEAGLAPIGLRYNFTGPGGRMVPYVEGMLGAVYLNVPRHVQGTRFNFVENAGLGLRVFMSDRVAVGFQARIRHTSNAGIRRPNHGFNTGFILIGLDYY